MQSKRGREIKLPSRSSTVVNRKRIPGVQAREEITQLLRAHDPETAEENLRRLAPEHVPLLRQLASETPLTNADGGVRRRAIAALGRFTDADNLNLLADIAEFDLDPAVRAVALLSLGATGVRLVTPILTAGLVARDPLEATAASKAVMALAARVGTAAVRTSVGKGAPGALVRRLEDALKTSEIPRRRKGASKRTRQDKFRRT